MLLTPSKGRYLRIILLFTSFFLIVNSGFSLISDEEAGPVISSVSINSCVGSITISVTSGALPYSYEWKDNMGTILPFSSFIASGLTAGNYTVEVTDNNGDSTGPATYTVTNPPDLVGTVVVNDVSCRGDSDAQVVVTMGNGNPGYDWELFNGSGGSIGTGSIAFPNQVITLTGLGIGNYTLSTEDQDGCTGDITFTITEPANFLGYSIGSSTDATCFNSTDGSISATGTGGWGNYTYRWIRVSDGAVIGSAATITGLAPGDYQLDIIDRSGTGCTITTPILTIDSPDEIIPSASISDALCNGDTNGSIDLSVIGGTAPYTYSWSNGAITQDISGLAAGAYTVTITDNAGCTDVETFTVSEPGVLTINPVITDVDCFGDNTGRIRSNVSGGTGPYSYSWSTGNTGRNLNNRTAGTYSLTVTDANGCMTTASGLTITQPTMALSKLSELLTDPACFGNSDGSINLTMQGGTAPYSYAWSNGDNTATASALPAGIHSVTVTDAAGCSITENFTLNNPIRIAVAPSLTLPTCNGGADGSISVVASNGTGPYAYNWNTGDSGPTINGLVAGTYTVTVSDAGGCSVVESIVLGEPAVITGNAVINNISCNGSNDGSIFLSVSGGTGAYTYAWSTGGSSSSVSGLTAGGYSVTITDASGCSIVENFTIIDPAPIGLTFTKDDVVCKGASTGNIDITPSGGTAPYSYLWSNGSTTQDLANVTAGTYTVTVKDASNCAVNLNVTIDEPALVLNLSGTHADVTCNGSISGSIDLTVTGGMGPYSYAWNNGATTEDVTGLAPGNYSVAVTDANGCIKAIGFTIAEPAPLLASAAATDISCFGAGDGAIALTVSGGTGPYTYSWADDGTVLTKDRSGLTSGNYTVTVTDANGCQAVESVAIIEPLQLATTDVLSNVNCFGESTGSINITVSGGVAPYSYLWSNGALTEDLNGISAGNYSVVITDANGCTLNDSFTITQPSTPLAKTESVQQITCNGAADGIINLTVTGGSAPYSYNWSNGSTTEDLSGLTAGNYTVVITDNNGCTITDTYAITDPPVLSITSTSTDITCFGADDGSIDISPVGGEGPYTFAWSNGETTEDVSGLSPGNYTVNITDNRGCSTNQNFVISEPTQLSLIYSVNNVSCFGSADGDIDITVSGGTAPYSFSWSNGSSGEDINSLIATDYTVTATDANGCAINETITITEPSAPLSNTATVVDISCFGGSDGSIVLNPTGGTAPYSYSWNTGSTNKDIFGLSDGSYQVTITDANGCQVIENYTINMPTALLVSGSQTNVLCNGSPTGAIDLLVSGGTGPYSYSWSNGETTEDLASITAGTYNVTVSDARGCAINRSFTITEPLALNVTDNIVDVACFGDADGSIDVSVSGGIGPYSYAWSNGETTQDLFNISGGTYVLIITDGNACQQTFTYTVDEPSAAMGVSGVVVDESCFGDNQGAVQLTVTGGTAPYTYLWNQGTTTKDVSGLGQGVYQVTVTDNNGCTIQGNFTIAGPTAISVVEAISDVSCNGQADGAIDIQTTGGTGSYTYLWSDGVTTEDRTNLLPGNYSVTITDGNACAYTRSYTITEPAALAIGYSATDVTCFGEGNGGVMVTVTGGVLPYSYAWSSGETTKDLNNLSGGSYVLTVTDNNGCLITETIQIQEPVALSVTPTITNETCFGDNQGSIVLGVSGGTGPYTYSWNQGSTSKDIFGLAQGTYQVMITDAQGCSIQSDYTVSGPTALTLASNISSVSCFGADNGEIDLTISGGTGPYSFAWSNGESTEDLMGLSPSTYSVVVTDANGCTTADNFTITEPLPLTINYQANNVSCFGADDGSIELTVTGGTLPYTYSWGGGESTKDLSNLAGGEYEITVRDARGCLLSTNITIGAPTAALSATAAITNALCYDQPDGRIELSVTGGTAPFNYLWSNGSNQKDLINAFAGTYGLTITDASGCVFTETYEIQEPAALTIDFESTSTSCFGDSDGSIIATPSGGTGPYAYVWSNGSTSKDLVNISGGTYNLTIIDASNCSITRSVEVGDSRDLTVDIQKRDVLCRGESSGFISLDVTGGSGTYTYTWNTGDAERQINDLVAGVYEVVISDEGGCSTTASVVISEPAEALTVHLADFEDLRCFGDESALIRAIPTGGIAPYTYLWSNGERTNQITGLGAGDYSVVVTDANGCAVQSNVTLAQPVAPITISTSGKLNLSCQSDNDGQISIDLSGGTGPYEVLWSTGSNERTITNLRTGDYTVRVRDAMDCVVERVFTITEPELLSLEDAIVNESQCYDDRNGAIELNLKGGTGPFTYQWNTGATTKNLIGISSGDYSVLVTDANGCQVQGNYALAEPALYRLSSEVSPISCIGSNDASISLNIEGGVGRSTILWNTGASTETLTNLGPGTYNVLVEDKNGCTIQRTFNIFDPLPLTLDAYIEDATRCNDPRSGRVNVIVSGGNEPYQYRWSNGTTASTLIDVLPGTYVVEVTDRFNCTVQGTYTVLQPEPLQVGFSTEPYIDCNNRVAGVLVKANVKGGVGKYQYNWSRGNSVNSELLVTEPGRLTIEVLDDRSCFQQKSIDIDVPELGLADFEYNAESIDLTGELASNDPVSFFDLSIGEVVDWKWEFGDGFDSNEVDPIHTYDSPGTYIVTLTITDRTGCETIKTTTLEITEGYRIMLPNAFTPNGDGNNDFYRPRMLGLTTIRFIVYNTWGEVIFSTDDLESKGWDGMIKGKRAENGNYIYKLIGLSFNGLKVEREGIFALMK
ncbi:PKD domain-containing protein [Roseivirga sp.]|uniref:PKD domain-containing protein n=1 Tax=Roseivirga sp. TaxID=1964215 RepID=UPI003B8D9E06